jgi:xylitol oxidase
MGKRIGPHLFISEIRSVAADQLWMSPHYGRASVAIHFTWKQDWPAVSALLPAIEKELAPFEARPHWGKLFSMPRATLEQRYEKLPAFRDLIATHDPRGKFRNEFLGSHIYRS